MIETLLLLSLNGLIWGLIIALIALGLSVIFGLLDIINIAHGDFFMVGTVLAWFVLEATGNFWVGFLLVPLICFILGALIQRVVIQPIRGAAALSIVATFGVSLILQEVVRMTFGATPHRMLPPVQGTVPLFGIQYELYRIYAAGLSITALGAFFVFLNYTKIGTWMRAVRHDRETATAMGIPAKLIYILTFGVGFALAGFGGVVAAPITTVDFRGGVDLLPVCFIAVIIGVSTIIGRPNFISSQMIRAGCPPSRRWKPARKSSSATLIRRVRWSRFPMSPESRSADILSARRSPAPGCRC
jgi:branched-chain amino acid transport system permease protein